MPAASGTAHAGTITWAEAPGTAPTWIFPVVPSTAGTVSSTNQFEFEMWRPLYWFTNGVQPIETPSMSMADEPVYSNGDKTITIRLKTNYRWSDGQPVTSKDALFFLDEVRAAVKESGANWSQYTPHIGIPDQIVSATTPSSTTLVINLNKPVNPLWMTDNAAAADPANAGPRLGQGLGQRPDPGLHQPGQREEDLRLPRTRRPNRRAPMPTNPLWQVVDGPYKLTVFNNTTGAFTMVPNPTYGGPHLGQGPDAAGGPVHLRHRGVQRGAVAQHRHRVHAADRRAHS